MRITVKAKPGAKEEKVEKITQPSFDFADDNQKEVVYKVWVKEPPEDGKANEAIILALAKHFEVKRVNVRLVLGANSKLKVFEIEM
jgi:uncharacterized protein YggU (UPF0235/DUF167 family)